MEQLSRVQLYQNLVQKGLSEGFITVLRANIFILLGVEEMFLTSDEGNEILEPDFTQLSSRIRDNVNRLEINELEGADYSVSRLRDNILRMIEDYERKDKVTRKSARNLFNKLIKALAAFNDKMLDSEIEFVRKEKGHGMPQVFLSHAYDDKAYSLALFDYFYEQGIYLYVGWMHNEIEDDGRVVKSMLQARLDESVQLLFLRTLNSELDIQGKQLLRPWCAWELGNFYQKKKGEEKYLINLYSVDCYSNALIHGLKLFTGVEGNRLQGTEIVPR